MYTDHSETSSYKEKKNLNDSDNSHYHSELQTGNDEDFKEFLDYVVINIDKFEIKIKDAYENINNYYNNPENCGKTNI